MSGPAPQWRLPRESAVAESRPPAERRSPRAGATAPHRYAVVTTQHADPTDLKNPALYINRELSWLEFNERVLDAGARPIASAARAREVPRHHRHEPRRVLHDPRGDDAEEAARGDRRRRAGRLQHRAAARSDARTRATHAAAIRHRRGPSCASFSRRSRSRCSMRMHGRPRFASICARYFSREICPGPDAAGVRPGPSVPVHFESEQELRGRRQPRRPHEVREGENAGCRCRVSSRCRRRSVR